MKPRTKRLNFDIYTRFLRCDQGSQLIEYGLMGVIVAIGCITLLNQIGALPGSIFETIRDALPF